MVARIVTVMLLSVLVAGTATDARALDQPLAGKRLVVRMRQRARLVLVTRDRIEAPAPGFTDDPTRSGARLEIGNPETGEWASFELPAAGWGRFDAGTLFRFRDPTRNADSSVRRLVVRHRKRLRLRTRGIGITLDESRQGTLAVVLTTGTRRYCTLFGGTIRRDEPGRFSARNAEAPAACPETLASATTTTATTIGTSTSTTTTTTASSSTSSTAEPTTTSTSSSSSSTAEPTTTSSFSSSSTSTSSSTSSTAEPTTTSTSSSSSSTAEPTTTSSSASSSTSTSSSTSSTAEPTTTSTSSSSSSTAEPTTTSSSTSSSTTSSTTSSTLLPCGGIAPICAGSCPPGQTCTGVALQPCTCQ